ncbi:hypothetical protein KY328_00565 [Candidatus Woesearchaeota archaeon]|nr:hypothetical protein [Candidatus Woesearchaeota archaeon]MBW3021389.1 hypothetical protein [Candidatus Woesearchaeota archaeon]
MGNFSITGYIRNNYEQITRFQKGFFALALIAAAAANVNIPDPLIGDYMRQAALATYFASASGVSLTLFADILNQDNIETKMLPKL